MDWAGPNAHLRTGKANAPASSGAAEAFRCQQTSGLARHPWGVAGRYHDIGRTPPGVVTVAAKHRIRSSLPSVPAETLAPAAFLGQPAGQRH
jgi:hypothetical protein